MTDTRRVAYEVTADFLELEAPAGHKRWLGPGAQLPEWVDPDRAAALASNGVIAQFEEI